jgi:hypothetical protein
MDSSAAAAAEFTGFVGKIEQDKGTVRSALRADRRGPGMVAAAARPW